MLYRDDHGYTKIRTIDEMPGVREFIEEGANLGDLWMEGQFDVGNPIS